MKKKLTTKEKVLADCDDEIWLLMKRIELKYKLNWNKARDLVNESIVSMYKN